MYLVCVRQVKKALHRKSLVAVFYLFSNLFRVDYTLDFAHVSIVLVFL